MGLVGPQFVGGTAALAFLLAAEVVAATAAVSEAALVYVARHRNLMISLLMIVVQAAADGRPHPRHVARSAGRRPSRRRAPRWRWCWRSALPRCSRRGCCRRLLGAPVQGWRWPLVWAAAAAILVGYGFTALPQRSNGPSSRSACR